VALDEQTARAPTGKSSATFPVTLSSTVRPAAENCPAKPEAPGDFVVTLMTPPKASEP
jgi:hypothetical protein